MNRIRIVSPPGEQSYSECACGARGDAIAITELSDREPRYIPGALHEPCTCPRCFTCQRLLEDDGRCSNLHCLNLGLHILAPD